MGDIVLMGVENAIGEAGVRIEGWRTACTPCGASWAVPDGIGSNCDEICTMRYLPELPGLACHSLRGGAPGGVSLSGTTRLSESLRASRTSPPAGRMSA